MVRTNTRDDGPGVSHTSVEEYYDPVRFQREVDLLFRKYPDRRRLLGPGAQARRLRHPQRHRPADPGGRAAPTACCAPSSMSAAIAAPRSSRSPAAPTSAPSSAPITAGATTSPAGWSASPTARPSARSTSSKHGLRRLKVAEKYGLIWVVPTALEDNEDASLDIDPYLGALKADLSGWDMQGWELHSFRADPAAHELEAGDRHLPRALPLPLPASRHGVPAVPRQHRDLRAHGQPHALGGRQAHAHRAGGPADGELAHPRPRHRVLLSSSPTRC